MQNKVKQPNPVRSLSRILAIAFFTLSAVFLLLNGTIAVVSNLLTYQDTISVRQLLVAQDAGKTVANFIQEKIGELRIGVEFANPASETFESYDVTLAVLLGHEPAFRHLALLDTNGEFVAQVSRLSSSGLQQFQDQIRPELQEAVDNDQAYISPVYIDDRTSEPLVLLAVEAHDTFGDPLGILVAELNLKFMWELVDQLEVGESGYAYVVDSQGTLIAFEDTSRVLRGENVAHISEVSEFVENPDLAADITPGAETYTGLNDGRVVGSYVPLGNPQWAIVTELPWTEAYRPVFQSIVGSVLTVLILAGLAGLIGNYIARRLAAPLINLTEVATRISAGELALQAEPSGPGEVVSLAAAFNQMTAELRQTLEGLEHRVADRTRALATSTEVSRRLSTILNQDELVREVVEEVKKAFDYYHVHIYLWDEKRENLMMAGGTGEAGRVMLASGHAIPAERGLVGRAAETGTVVLVSDVSQSIGWLPNPLLPETKSEIAVPILVGDEVLGVLDVQHFIVGGLDEKDADLLQAIASQVAIALKNAQAYASAQTDVNKEARQSEIIQKIQSTTSIEEALKVAVREVGRAVAADQTIVRLKGENGHENQ